MAASAAAAAAGDGTREAKEADKQSVTVDGPIICPGHSRPVPHLGYSKIVDDRFFLVSSCLDGMPMLRDGVTGDWIGTFQGHKGAVWNTVLNKATDRAATASADFSCKLWNAVSGDVLHSWEQGHVVKSVDFSRDEKTLLSGGMHKKLYTYDLEKPDADPLCLDTGTQVSFICALDDPQTIVVGGRGKDVMVLDRRTAAVVKRLETSENLSSMSVSPDNAVITGTAGKGVYFWRSDSFDLIKRHSLQMEVGCAAYSPQTRKFVSGSPRELWVRAYDFASGEELACNKGHHGPVRYLAIAPDGKSYASGSEDGTIRIWDWPNEVAKAQQ